MKSPKTIKDLFSFPGFVANARLTGLFGDRYARVVTLRRRKKQPFVPAVAIDVPPAMIKPSNVYATCRSQVTGSTWSLNAGVSTAQGVAACM
jgi:hypothetical protein